MQKRMVFHCISVFMLCRQHMLFHLVSWECHFTQLGALWVFFFFFDHTLSMWKFPGQGLNPHYSSNPSCGSDNAGSLSPLHPKRTPALLFKVVPMLRLLGQSSSSNVDWMNECQQYCKVNIITGLFCFVLMRKLRPKEKPVLNTTLINCGCQTWPQAHLIDTKTYSSLFILSLDNKNLD